MCADMRLYSVAFYIDAHLTHRTHAARDIQPGEELTIAYIDISGTRAARQARIHQAWGFECSCSHCSTSPEDSKASDSRLAEIETIETQLGDFHSNQASQMMIVRLLQLCERERLYTRMAGAYTLAAMNYNLFGNWKAAKKYAGLAVQAGNIEYGPNADVIEMQDLERNPRGHWTWNGRVQSQS